MCDYRTGTEILFRAVGVLPTPGLLSHPGTPGCKEDDDTVTGTGGNSGRLCDSEDGVPET